MGKGVSCVYKHIQHNWPYPYINTTFFVPPSYVSSLQNDGTSGCGANMVDLIQTSPISNPTTTNKV